MVRVRTVDGACVLGSHNMLFVLTFESFHGTDPGPARHQGYWMAGYE